MRFDDARPRPDDPYLRYSLAEFRELIFAVFEAAGVRTMVEIGAEGGAFTEELVAWAEGHAGRLVSIDPSPSDLVRRLAARSEAAVLLEQTSLEALPGLEAADAYLVDGDHNYFTVSSELGLIADAAAKADPAVFPLLVLDDVGWPSGRRDQYYAPDRLPSEAVHPYDFGGVVPWSAETGPRGFRGEGAFAFAGREGGARNGVLTAVEDFLAGHPGWDLLTLPCLFGLGFAFPSAAPWAGEVRRILEPLADNPLLARLESNRILLYLRLLDEQDELAERRRRAAERVASLEADIADLRAELALAREALREARTPAQPDPAH